VGERARKSPKHTRYSMAAPAGDIVLAVKTTMKTAATTTSTSTPAVAAPRAPTMVFREPGTLAVLEHVSMESVVPGAKTQPPPGVSEKAHQNSLEPNSCFKHDLLPGETVVNVYDVHMPSDLIPRWRFYLYCICTLGVFWVMWSIYMWCLRKGCCTLPKIAMTRGRMAITSTKRVLVWKTQFHQVRKGCCCNICCCIKNCAPPIDWESVTISRTYNIHQINDIALHLNQKKGFLCGICCCTETHYSSIRVNFGGFKLDQSSIRLAFQTMPANLYKAILQNTFSPNVVNIWAMIYALLAALLHDLGNSDWVDIVSERVDETVKDIENPDFKDVHGGLSKVHRTLVSLLTESRSAVWKAPSDKTHIIMPHDAGAVTNVNDFATMNLITDDSCAAPDIYVPLAPGEQIIATTADVYFVTFCDQFKVVLCVIVIIILSISQLWILLSPVVAMCARFIIELRAKRMSRNGYILTTNRIVHVSVWRIDTWISICCPSFVLCCFPTQQQCIVRSLFPKKVESGAIERRGLSCSARLLTSAGAISMHFNLGKVILADVLRAESRITKRLAFFKALSTLHSRDSVIDGTQAKINPNCAFDNFEKIVLPQVEGEKLIARYDGRIYEDSCTKTCKGTPMEGCCTTRRTYHPACCLAATCGIKPSFAKTSVLVSDATVYAVKNDSNSPYSCFPDCCLTFIRKDDWAIYWTPVTGLAGAEVGSMLLGTESFWSRCCYQTWCGNNCCPLLRGSVQISLIVQDGGRGDQCVKVCAQEISQFQALRDKPEVVAFRQGVASVQGLLSDVKSTNSMT
jgi:hypothetical protein